MREILFKALPLIGSKWVFGQYVFINGQHFIYQIGGPVAIRVDTLSQSTGLKDKMEKLIFENDIITTEYGNRKVYWHPKFACWSATDFGDSLHLFHEEGVIVGTSFEQPELLDK